MAKQRTVELHVARYKWHDSRFWWYLCLKKPNVLVERSGATYISPTAAKRSAVKVARQLGFRITKTYMVKVQ